MKAIRSRAAVIAVIGFLGLMSAACTTSPQSPNAGPATPVWMIGDSISAGTGYTMLPQPYVGSLGNTAFVAPNREHFEDRVAELIAANGQPEVIMIMGGVIDIAQNVPTATVIEAMQDLEDTLVSMGIDVVWVPQPGYTYATGLATLADWMNTRPLVADCRAFAGSTTDGIHPKSYNTIAACISGKLLGMGFDWTPVGVDAG